MAGVTIPGASGLPPIVFTITGTSAVNQATAFQNALLAESNAGSLVAVSLSGGSPQVTTPGALNEITPGLSSSFTLTSGGQYTLSDAGSPIFLTGSTAGGDTVLAGGSFSYTAVGDGNTVTFTDGANVYQGGTSSDDVVTGGDGYDMINAGTGSGDTVFSGGGYDTIFLGDTAAPGDITFLGDGLSTVVSTGVADTVAAEAPGQLIFLQGPATASDLVTLQPDSAGDLGNDTIVIGAASVSVFDSVGGNQIFGGSGNLTFTAAAGSVSDSIVGATGGVSMFGASGTDISFTNDTTSTSTADIFVAGAGNETLDGSFAAGGFTFFGDTVGTDSVSTSVIGGSGSNYFSTGAGSETLDGGSGVNVFNLATVGGTGAMITINDFSAADSVSFGSGATSDFASETVSGGNLVVTLTDNTTVTFVGITDLTGHII